MMYHCYAQHEYGGPCTNKTCRKNKSQSVNVQEKPERDVPTFNDQLDNFPAAPPEGGDWELQYCKWSGWTWVKKVGKDGSLQCPCPRQSQEQFPSQQRPEESKKGSEKRNEKNEKNEKKSNKGGGLFSCFKKKEPKQTGKAASSQVSGVNLQTRPTSEHRPVQSSYSGHVDRNGPHGMDYDGYYCCNCNQMCCPCMLSNQCCCCCCCLDDSGGEPEKQTCCKSMQTQTSYEVKEQATKISEVHLPKRNVPPLRKRRCMCRPVCCPCRRNCCCPCVQPTCCPCTKSGEQNSNSSIPKVNGDIINYCLTRNFKTPTKVDFMSEKQTNFTALHKSLDLLLKNNINIMNLFDNKKEIRDSKPSSSLGSNHTISSLSPDNLLKKSDQEHCKLLTAVCDALLSSHKFDNDKLSSSVQPLKLPSTKSSQGNCEAKDSQNSFSFFQNGDLIGKILSNSNFPTLTKDGNNQCQSKKKPQLSLSRKSSTKLLRNKSRILTAPRFSNRAEALRKYIDLMKYTDKNSRKNIKKTDKKVKIKDDSRPVLTEVFKNVGLQQNTSLRMDPIDNLLLNSTNFVSSSSTKTNAEEQNLSLFEDSTLNFADLNLFLNLDDSQGDTKEK